jgi:2-keto-3-deoxy-L-rhamnonate aldolase RhmA
MTGKELSTAIKDGTRVYGTLIVSTSPKWAMEIKKLGIDFVFIDTEHIPLERAQMSWMCIAYKSLNIAPVVRIPSPDPYQACMALDAGACGVMVPYVETVEQVKALIGAVKLRPLKGKKLHDVLEGRTQLSSEEEDYLTRYNENNLLLLNIESKPGLDAMDDILELPGVDGVIIGPHDLSISLGIPEQYTHSLFIETVSQIICKARAHNIGVGIHYSYDIEQEIGWANEGMNITLHGSDLTGFLKYIGSNINTIKKALENDTSLNQKSVNMEINI